MNWPFHPTYALTGILMILSLYSDAQTSKAGDSLSIAPERVQNGATTEHKYKSYIDEEGNIYWQKKMPVYLFISSTPEGDDLEKLESVRSAQYADPFYLDTEGINWIRSQWAVDKNGRKVVPETELMFEIYADGLPPTTSVSFIGKKSPSKGSVRYKSKLKIRMKSIDYMSGLENIYYSLNGAAFQVAPSELVISEPGAYELKVYAVDNVGNQETERKFTFTVIE